MKMHHIMVCIGLMLASCRITAQEATFVSPAPSILPAATETQTPTTAPSATPTNRPVENTPADTSTPTATITNTPGTPTATPSLDNMDTSQEVYLAPGSEDWEAIITTAFPATDNPQQTSYFQRLEVHRRGGPEYWIPVEKWQAFGLGYDVPVIIGWGPDIQALYFARKIVPDGCAFRLYYVDVQRIDLQTGEVELVPDIPSGTEVTLSPDGEQLAYLASDAAITLRSLTGGEEQQYDLRPITETIDIDVLNLTWSPDSTTLAFIVHYGGCNSFDSIQRDVILLDVTTGEMRVLVEKDSRRLLFIDEWIEPDTITLTAFPEDATLYLDVTTGTLSS